MRSFRRCRKSSGATISEPGRRAGSEPGTAPGAKYDPIGFLGGLETHDCNSLSTRNVDETVILMGWVQRRRDHGGLIFVDLRDRQGLTQVVFDPQHDATAHDRAQLLRSEFVIAVRGRVRRRPEGMTNPKLGTGEIEVIVTELRILNPSLTPPFQIEEDLEASENIRLRYRYLDLRRPSMYQNLYLRHRAAQLTRNYFTEQGFLEIETPVLTKSTPEGARDYLVPSRVNPGKFYALPQSPQIFKQLLMVAGFERYFQITKCFRDEDLRADRQPEFTQVDLELSFVREEQIYGSSRGGSHGSSGFPREGTQPALPPHDLRGGHGAYGTDRPDLRFGLELVNVTDVVAESEFRVFRQAIERGGMVKAIRVPGGAPCPERIWTTSSNTLRYSGLRAWPGSRFSRTPGSRPSPSSSRKTFAPGWEKAARRAGRPYFICADQTKIVNDALGNVRVRLGHQLGLIDPKEFNFVWVTHFPLLEWDHEEKRYTSVHHPFTAPLESDEEFLEERPSAFAAEPTIWC